MKFDVERHLGAVERSVVALERDGKPARAVTLARSYDTTVEDLWDATTNPERLPRWFAPVRGDFRLGGRYQIEGNAGGEITACAPPKLLALTWEYGGDVSWVDLRLSAEGPERARLRLTHTAHLSPHWQEYGPGAAGVGWELALLGLALHLADPTAPKPDEESFAASPDGKAFIADGCKRWGEAAIVSGEDAERALAAARRTAAFYTGETGGTS
ncbi:SRPBCC family protein [Amphiplicatus metriothermophilus]|uniref:Uncharacterized conserved protein YndB, AHSA1/START domain n=1 Tax=Amphiplicatus metriothermophilus TaxID=1519374 RepID=A0A239PSW4_9PROT|nr:SRPBCC family protein [Amphiplicatus metriothermophilus]MBB5519305.1 uncharacterized protein YndB with AHSA1/START domain [Amphiplicatus metriothermophilus]SNT73374.1 Uncharacterized conserved protein YndB, AHSA1/START domain [Amphiplicatus metriothermophilus]